MTLEELTLAHINALVKHGLIERHACGKCRFSRIQNGSAT